MTTIPFYPGDLLLGKGSNIGLCTLWTPKSKYVSQLPHVQVIGNLYSHFGIGIMVRNVLATPQIQHIVVTGVDNPEPKQRQATQLLNGDVNANELYLKKQHLDEFYRRVTVHDARHIGVREQDKLTELLTGLPIQTRSYNPIIVPLPEVSQQTYPTARSGHLIRADSIKEAHYALLREIRLFGELTQPDSEGHKRQELWQLTVCLSRDCTFDSAPLYEQDELLRYGEALWRGCEPGELAYHYGHTLRHKFGDQVQAVLEAFRKKPETFRTVLSLWEPLQSMLRDDEPCLITIHPRIRNGILDMYAYIRSNEMFRAWPKNVAGLRYWQTKLAQELSTEVGEFTVTSGSANLYDRDWHTVDNYLENKRERAFQFDQKGNWSFTASGDQFIAEHYYDGTLVQRFETSSIKELERRVLPFISDISHGVYIGKRLASLEKACLPNCFEERSR